MTGEETKLPPELWRMIAAYLNLTCIHRLTMSSSYLASALAFDAHRNWEIDCCRAASDEIYNQPSRFTYRTSLDSFFEALNGGLAPAFAERVVFDFCRHPEPIRKPTQRRLLNKLDWPLENASKLLHALDASEIVLSVRDAETGPSHICNEPMLKVVLLGSLKKSLNTTVKLRLWQPVLKGGPNHFYKTISTPSMSRMSLKANVLLVSSPATLRTSSAISWDAVEFETDDGLASGNNLGCKPSLKCFTWRYPYAHLYGFPRYFKHCQRLFVTARITHHMSLRFRPGTMYYIEHMPSSPFARVFTEISVHMPLREWAKVLYDNYHTLANVRILEIHHTDKACERISYPVVLMKLLSNFMLRLPNLEVMTFKVDYDYLKDTAHCSPLIEGQVLTENFCQHCKQYTYAIKIDVKSVRDSLKASSDRVGKETFALIDEICKR